MRTCRLFLLFCLSCVLSVAHAQTTVESFSPDGTVKGIRQVTARFSGQMVAFGDLRLSDPFDIDCPAEGKGRWIDGSNWSYDFARDLPAGVACRFTLKSELRDLAGAPLAGTRSFAFDTGGPAVVEALPREGMNIDERQVFVLALDAAPREDTLADRAWCRADGINEKIPARLVTGKEREAILDARKDFVRRRLSIYHTARGVLWRRDVAVKGDRSKDQPIVVLQCARTLPADVNMSLVWGAGIASATGIATTEDQVLSYRTRPDFSAKFSCDRTRRNGPCIPVLPMRLWFSAPLPVAQLQQVALVGPGGKRWQPSFDQEVKPGMTLNGLSFPGPLPANTSFRLELPDGLRDDADRPLVNAARFPMTVRTGEAPPLVKFPARFGIIESKGDRLLPVTVRNVEAPVAGRSLAVEGGTLRVADNADEQVMDWLRKLAPRGDWQPAEQYADTLKSSVHAEVVRTGRCGQALRTAETGRAPRVRGDRHPAEAARLLRRRTGQPEAGQRAAQTEGHRVCQHGGPRDEHGRALQAGQSVVARLGHVAGQGPARGRRQGRRARLLRQAAVGRHVRCAGHRPHRHRAAGRPLRLRGPLLRQRAQGRRFHVHAVGLEPGHRIVALQREHRGARRAQPDRHDRVRPHAAAHGRDGAHEALRAPPYAARHRVRARE
jgi:hypothetical protein